MGFDEMIAVQEKAFRLHGSGLRHRCGIRRGGRQVRVGVRAGHEENRRDRRTSRQGEERMEEHSAHRAEAGGTAGCDPAGPVPFRSGEYSENDIEIVYFNFRHYNPVNGVWTGRDPIVEDAFLKVFLSSECIFNDVTSEPINLFAYCKNDAILAYDSLGLIFPAAIYIPSYGTPCPDYCCNCNLNDVDALISSQRMVIRQIQEAIKRGEENLITPFTVKEWANAAGGRSKQYEQASDCIKFATDRLENDFVRSLFDLLRWGMTSFAEMGKGRSETFIRYLEEVKKICSTCVRGASA